MKRHDFNDLTIESDMQQKKSNIKGKVLVLNGTSSSGKTTLSMHLKHKYGFHVVNIDDIVSKLLYTNVKNSYPNIVDSAQKLISKENLTMIFNRLVVDENCSDVRKNLKLFHDLRRAVYLEEKKITCLTQQITDLMYQESKDSIDAGINVVVDILAVNNADFEMLSKSFGDCEIITCLLYVSLEENLRKCFQRNNDFINGDYDVLEFRYPKYVMLQFQMLYNIETCPNIDSNDIPLADKIDKNKLGRVLGVTKYCETILLEHLKGCLAYYYLTIRHFDADVSVVPDFLKLMKIGDEEAVFIFPKLKYNIYIKNYDRVVLDELASLVTHDISERYSKPIVLESKSIKNRFTEVVDRSDNTDFSLIIYHNNGLLPSVLGAGVSIFECSLSKYYFSLVYKEMYMLFRSCIFLSNKYVFYKTEAPKLDKQYNAIDYKTIVKATVSSITSDFTLLFDDILDNDFIDVIFEGNKEFYKSYAPGVSLFKKLIERYSNELSLIERQKFFRLYEQNIKAILFKLYYNVVLKVENIIYSGSKPSISKEMLLDYEQYESDTDDYYENTMNEQAMKVVCLGENIF